MAGFILKAIWDALKELQVEDKNMSDKMAHIEVLVVGSYARREELLDMTKAIFEKLDKIDAKLDKKVSFEQCEHFHTK